MRNFRKSSLSKDKFYEQQHRFEHWYRDNTVYFITSRCRDKRRAFETPKAKEIFCKRFFQYSKEYRFVPFVWTLMDNHHHVLGYLKKGENVGPMMRHLHGSVAKLVNDLLPERIKPFWYDSGKQGYFDGCIRDEKQCRRAYRYTMLQSVRHRICRDWRAYPYTFVNVELDVAVKRAMELNAFMQGVRYKRYEK